MKMQDTGYGIQDSGAKNGEPPRVLHPASRIPHPDFVSHPESHILDPVSLQRVRWRSRRGLLELDIVLGRFIEKEYAQLDVAGQRAFEALLDMPDNPLWDMIAGRAERGVQEAAHTEQQALLEKIRAA